MYCNTFHLTYDFYILVAHFHPVHYAQYNPVLVFTIIIFCVQTRIEVYLEAFSKHVGGLNNWRSTDLPSY